MNEIKLYSCWKCWRIMDEADQDRPAGCPCGSRMVAEANPSPWVLVKYFLLHPRQLLTLVREGLSVEEALPEIKPKAVVGPPPITQRKRAKKRKRGRCR